LQLEDVYLGHLSCRKNCDQTVLKGKLMMTRNTGQTECDLQIL